MISIIHWLKSSEYRPHKSGQYLAMMLKGSGRYVTTLEYSKDYDLFNCHDKKSEEDAVAAAFEPDYWAFLPEELRDDDV